MLQPDGRAMEGSPALTFFYLSPPSMSAVFDFLAVAARAWRTRPLKPARICEQRKRERELLFRAWNGEDGARDDQGARREHSGHIFLYTPRMASVHSMYGIVYYHRIQRC